MNYGIVLGLALCIIVSFVTGYEWCDRGREKAIIEQQKNDIKAVKEIGNKAEKLKTANKPVIEVINATKDDCLDQPYPADIQHGLREAHDRATR